MIACLLRTGLFCLLVTSSTAQGQDIDALLDPHRPLPDYSIDIKSGTVTDRKALEAEREQLLSQFTKGQCSPAIAQVGGNVTVTCYVVANADKEGTFVVERVTKLIPSDPDERGASFDIIMANMRTTDAWVDRITLVGLGASNRACNPNPIATFRYKIKIKAGKEAVASVSSPDEKLSLPASARTGRFEHSYCDGYLFVSYEQAIKVPKREKVSYVLSLDSIEFELTSAGIQPGYYWSFDETRDIDKEMIPRLGMTLSQVRQMGGIASRFSPRKLLEENEPSYVAPLWTNWFVFLHLSDGTIFGGKTSFNASGSDLSKLWDGKSGGSLLFAELERVGIAAPVASSLFESYWKREGPGKGPK